MKIPFRERECERPKDQSLIYVSDSKDWVSYKTVYRYHALRDSCLNIDGTGMWATPPKYWIYEKDLLTCINCKSLQYGEEVSRCSCGICPPLPKKNEDGKPYQLTEEFINLVGKEAFTRLNSGGLGEHEFNLMKSFIEEYFEYLEIKRGKR